MTQADPFERLVEDWLASAAPVAVPAELHGSIVDAARRRRQRPRRLAIPSLHDLLRSARWAVDLAALVVLAAAAVNLLPGSTPIGPGGPPSPTVAPSTPQASRAGQTPEVHPLNADYTVGRHTLTVDGVRFSFRVPAGGWEPYDGFLLSKSVVGPQGAEGVVFWAGFPDGLKADACPYLEGPVEPVGQSPDLIAQAIAEGPGTELLEPPSDVTIGGRAATHVVVAVREDLGCDPGYFYNWKAKTGGALWVETSPGETISAWIVGVNGRLLFIGALTHPDATPRLEQEIEAIVASIVFE